MICFSWRPDIDGMDAFSLVLFHHGRRSFSRDRCLLKGGREEALNAWLTPDISYEILNNGGMARFICAAIICLLSSI